MDKKLTTFYIVRHGQSVGNVLFDQGKDMPDGEFGPELTDEGRKQAKKRAAELGHISFDAIYSSNFIRATQTAEIMKLERDITHIIVKELRERNYGSLDGKMNEYIRKRLHEKFEALSHDEKMTYKHVSDMESLDEAATRFITYLREVAISSPGKTILIIGHGDVMRAFLVKLGWATFDEFHRHSSDTIENTGYIVVTSDGTDFFIKETKGIHKKSK